MEQSTNVNGMIFDRRVYFHYKIPSWPGGIHGQYVWPPIDGTILALAVDFRLPVAVSSRIGLPTSSFQADLFRRGIGVTVSHLTGILSLRLVAGRKGLARTIRGGYCGDLLSDVMANAPEGCIWLTVQQHQNIVAVAVHRKISAIVLTGGNEPDGETRRHADREGIPLLLWPGSGFNLAARLAEVCITK